MNLKKKHSAIYINHEYENFARKVGKIFVETGGWKHLHDVYNTRNTFSGLTIFYFFWGVGGKLWMSKKNSRKGARVYFFFYLQ